MKTKIILQTIVLLILITYVDAYSVSSPATVHQRITNESQVIWWLLPYEIKDHIGDNYEKK